MHLRIPPLPVAALTLLALLPGGTASGGDPPATDPSAAEPVPCTEAVGRKVYTLDHPSGGPPPTPVRLKDGERFVVKIDNTIPERFVYKLFRQRVALPPGEKLGVSAAEEVCLGEVHDKQYAGYTLVIQPKEGLVPGYPAMTVISIPVQTPQWTYGFAGAFVGSGLTDPVFFVEDETTTGAIAHVVRQSEDHDWARLGTAAFIHATPPNLPIAISFGVGIADGDNPTYYLGPSVRMGEQAFLTAGLAVGAVDALPAGIRVGDHVNDANALANLRSQTRPHVFIALSYAFLNGRKALDKPFAPTPVDEAATAGGRSRNRRRR